MAQSLTITIPPYSSNQSLDYNASASPDLDGPNDALIRTYKQIPLTELSKRTLDQLSSLLNRMKILRSEEGHERDWRGVLALADQEKICDVNAISSNDPMRRVIQLWCQNNSKTATFYYLLLYLGYIDRWDVCDDISENLANDARNYAEKLRKQSNAQKEKTQFDESDEHILTDGDTKGLGPQKYDAFLLFADADMGHALEIIARLEDDPANNFKLCIKQRDLVIGTTFPHVALIQIIEERCKHLIVIITKNFLESRENTFLVDYTQSIQIERKTEHKIIPLIYETVEIPPNLRIYYHLKYYDNTFGLFNFWGKLADSIRKSNRILPETPLLASAREEFLQMVQNATIQQNNNNNVTKPLTDIPKISVNGNPLIDDYDDGPKQKKEHNLFTKKRSSLRGNSNKHLLASDNNNAVLRSAQSCNQLDSAQFYDTNLPQMSGLSVSTCSAKKKKKWSTKLFKKVFNRSSSNLNTS